MSQGGGGGRGQFYAKIVWHHLLTSSKHRDLFRTNFLFFFTLTVLIARFTVKFGSCIVCLSSKVLIIWPNTTTQIWYSNLVLYTTTRFRCPDQPSSGRCRTHKKNVQGERPFFTAVRIIKILFQKVGIIRLKLIHNCVTECLRYNQCETLIQLRQKRDEIT